MADHQTFWPIVKCAGDVVRSLGGCSTLDDLDDHQVREADDDIAVYGLMPLIDAHLVRAGSVVTPDLAILDDQVVRPAAGAFHRDLLILGKV